MSLMSCSAEPEAEAPVPATGTAICFSGQQGEEQVTRGNKANGANEANRANETNRANGAYRLTRATTPLHEKVDNFRVWGYKNMSKSNGEYSGLQSVIPGYTVKWSNNSAGTTTTNSDGWEYVNQQSVGQPEQTIKYWDWSAKAYRFFGVTGNDGSESNGNYVFTLSVNTNNPETCPYYSRLWLCDESRYGHTVQLEFVRPFARVRFMFIYENPDDQANTTLSYKRFGPTIESESIHMSGTVTISYPLTGTATTESWSATSNDEGIQALEKDYYETSETPNDGNVRKWYYVLPVASQGSYSLTVTVNGVEKTAAVPAEFMSWKPGYQYTYIFKIHPDGGVTIDSVQSAFTPWETTDIGNHPVYNW